MRAARAALGAKALDEASRRPCEGSWDLAWYLLRRGTGFEGSEQGHVPATGDHFGIRRSIEEHAPFTQGKTDSMSPHRNARNW